MGNDGREHEITALERSALDLNIPKIPHAVQKLWEERGVTLSDDSDSQTMDAIHVLIGADYVNLFIHEKKVVDEHGRLTLVGFYLDLARLTPKRPNWHNLRM